MEFTLVSDLIDALGKVANGLKALASLPKSERDHYRQLLDDTYQLIDTTLNMIILRLGDISHIVEEDKFLKEVRDLDNYSAWLEAERKFRLCSSLSS